MPSTICLLVLLAFVWPAQGFAAPYTPAADDEVVLSLPSAIINLKAILGDSRLQAMTVADMSPADQQSRLARVRQFLKVAYDSDSEKAWSYARAELQPWWNQAEVSPQIGILIAIVQQHDHEFIPAIKRLNHVLETRPDFSQARLQRAQALLVIGRYEDAMADCGFLADRIPGGFVASCMAQAMAMTGHAPEAWEILRTLLAKAVLSQAETIEIELTLATLAEQLGYTGDADQYYRLVLEKEPDHAYVLAHYAAMNLRLGRAGKVIELLQEDSTKSDRLSLELQVMRLQALLALEDSRAMAYLAELEDTFATAFARGEPLPYKDYARFAHYVQDDPAVALPAAWRNWQLQKETGDLLLLLETAAAVNNPKTLTLVARWVKEKGLQDVRIEALLENIPKATR